MKPHLFIKDGYWVCRQGLIVALGASPVAAYRSFLELRKYPNLWDNWTHGPQFKGVA